MIERTHGRVIYMVSVVCFLNDPATTKIYPLSLHDALPIYLGVRGRRGGTQGARRDERGDQVPSSHPPLCGFPPADRPEPEPARDRKSTRLNSSHANISYAVFCLKKKKIPSSSFLYSKLCSL